MAKHPSPRLSHFCLLSLASAGSLSAATLALPPAYPITVPPGAGFPNYPQTVAASDSGDFTLTSAAGAAAASFSTLETITFTDPGACVEISFDLELTATASMNVTNDGSGRGFGDSNNQNTAQNQNDALTFDLTATNLSITSLSGLFIQNVTGTINFGITEFQLHDNGGSTPSIDYATDDTSGGAVTFGAFTGTNAPSVSAASDSSGGRFTNASGGSDDDAILQFPAIASTSATNLVLDSGNAWNWINDIGFGYSADLMITKVPEPSRAILLGIGLVAMCLHRRR